VPLQQMHAAPDALAIQSCTRSWPAKALFDTNRTNATTHPPSQPSEQEALTAFKMAARELVVVLQPVYDLLKVG